MTKPLRYVSDLPSAIATEFRTLLTAQRADDIPRLFPDAYVWEYTCEVDSDSDSDSDREGDGAGDDNNSDSDREGDGAGDDNNSDSDSEGDGAGDDNNSDSDSEGDGAAGVIYHRLVVRLSNCLAMTFIEYEDGDAQQLEIHWLHEETHEARVLAYWCSYPDHDDNDEPHLWMSGVVPGWPVCADGVWGLPLLKSFVKNLGLGGLNPQLQHYAGLKMKSADE